MTRLIVLTTVMLFVISFALSYAFSESTDILWRDIQLRSGEVLLAVENRGKISWERGTVAVKVFDLNDKLIENVYAKIVKSIRPGQKEVFIFPLKKKLQQGKSFQVVAYLQQGKARIVQNKWNDVPVFDFPAVKKEKLVEQIRKIGTITEPKQLRNTIQRIDVRKAITAL